jgi:TubC N-terminal docking domain
MIGEFLAELSRRGVSVSLEGGRIAVRPAQRLTDADREMLRRIRSALVEYLSGPVPEPWNLAAALHLMDQSDAAVEQSGVRGTHPEIEVAVKAVCAAYAAKDLAGVRVACKTMTDTLRRIAGK